MQDKKKRNLKVYGQSNGYNYQDVPTIVLKGKWLETAGFDIGDNIFLSCEDGQLVITNEKRCSSTPNGMH